MSTPRSHKTLAERWRRLRTVPGLGRDVLALVVMVALGVGSAGYLLSQVNFTLPWSQRYEIRAEVADAIAVSPANAQEVRIAGVKIGLISKVEPTDHNTSILTLQLEPGHTVYDNAHAVLRPVNPLNQMYLTLNPGGPPGKPLSSGDLIPLAQTSRPIQADEVLDKLDDKSRAALTSLLAESDNALANAPETLPAGLRAADQSMHVLKPVVDRLEKRHDNIEKLVSGLSQLTTGLGRNDARLTSLVDSTQYTLGVLADRNDEFGRTLQELPGTTDALKRALHNTSELSQQLNPTLDHVKDASDELPKALNELRDALDPLDDTIDSARPVVDKAKPFVKDLKASIGDLKEVFDDLRPVTACLDEYTEKIAPWMYDFAAFTYNTNSSFGTRDVNGAFPRGFLTLDPTSPLGGMHKAGAGEALTNRYQDAPSVSTGLPYPPKGSGECR